MSEARPSHRSPSTYCLVPVDSADRDTLDVIGFVAACWQYRKTFVIFAVTLLVPALYWAVSTQPRVEVSLVLEPPTSGMLAPESRYLVPAATMVSQCKEVVFAELLARSEPDSDRTKFKDIIADAREDQSSSCVILIATAPAAQVDLAKEFLSAATSALEKVQAPRVERLVTSLDSQVRGLDQTLDSINAALASPTAAPSSAEISRLELERERLQYELRELAAQRALCGPLVLLRGALETPPDELLAWRTKQVLLAIVGAAAAAAIGSTIVALIAGVRRRLREEELASYPISHRVRSLTP